ncbi:type I methionyl aminopeptidase [Pleomorphochaeta sp. DL1XJH-081]|uniref:type I methionyl aminopeptidase n=1 Tax=Pleomorphochaeta sp. DL1XJH-081 TaxID=3409690 RepID=UPI003BB6A10C
MITLKTPDQIKGIEASCRLLAQLHDSLGGFIEPGMTTKEIDNYCYDFIVSHKGRPAFLNYMGFPASACISVNDEVIHGIPGKRKIEKGDLVSIDLGIDLKGYYSDAARTFIAGGSSTKENELLVKVTKECLELGIEGAKRPNARIHDISAPIYKHANSFGFGVVRDYCGHGVGLSLHEEPQIPNYVSARSPNPRLRVGMVLAIEPMINLGTKNIRDLDDGWTVVTADGKPSAHFEHTVAITEDGVKILTVAE